MRNSVTREELDSDYLAIADVVYHDKYGLLSFQPMSVKDYFSDDKMRMSTKEGMMIWIPKDDRLWSPTVEERNDYWKELPEKE